MSVPGLTQVFDAHGLTPTNLIKNFKTFVD